MAGWDEPHEAALDLMNRIIEHTSSPAIEKRMNDQVALERSASEQARALLSSLREAKLMEGAKIRAWEESFEALQRSFEMHLSEKAVYEEAVEQYDALQDAAEKAREKASGLAEEMAALELEIAIKEERKIEAECEAQAAATVRKTASELITSNDDETKGVMLALEAARANDRCRKAKKAVEETTSAAQQMQALMVEKAETNHHAVMESDALQIRLAAAKEKMADAHLTLTTVLRLADEAEELERAALEELIYAGEQTEMKQKMAEEQELTGSPMAPQPKASEALERREEWKQQCEARRAKATLAIDASASSEHLDEKAVVVAAPAEESGAMQKDDHLAETCAPYNAESDAPQEPAPLTEEPSCKVQKTVAVSRASCGAARAPPPRSCKNKAALRANQKLLNIKPAGVQQVQPKLVPQALEAEPTVQAEAVALDSAFIPVQATVMAKQARAPPPRRRKQR